MRNDVARLLLALLTIALGGAAEEILPKVAGFGFPILLCACASFSVRRPVAESALFAVAAGAAEDALSGLPFVTSVSYFLALAALARSAKGSFLAALVAVAVYPLWLALWTGMSGLAVFCRMLAAVPLGAVTAFATERVLRVLERRASLDEA